MSNQPVYRRPRSHSYACRCPKCTPQGGVVERYGIIGPLALLAGLVAVIGFWPAMAWHGQTDTGGWRWDIHSTIAELVYFGVIAFLGTLIWLGNRPPQRTVRPPRGPLNVEAMPPPPPSMCVTARRHLNAVRVESIIDPDVTVAYWCEECGTQLGEEFGRLARPCCGTPPGGWHRYNCPHRL